MSSLLHVTTVENLRKSEIDTSVILGIVPGRPEKKWILHCYLYHCMLHRQLNVRQNFLVNFLFIEINATLRIDEFEGRGDGHPIIFLQSTTALNP